MGNRKKRERADLEHRSEAITEEESRAKVSKEETEEAVLLEKAEEEIKEFQEKIQVEVKPIKKVRKQKIIKIVLLVVLFACSLVVVFPVAQGLGDGDMVALDSMLKNMNGVFFGYAILCFVLLIVIGGARNAYITRITSKKFMPFKCTRIFLLGRFYDNITPLATGGQPFEIYELNKNGIPGGTAAAIPLIRYFIQMFTLTPVCLVLFIINSSVLSVVEPTVATVISVSAYVGMGVFLIVPSFLVVVTVAPKFGMWLAHLVIKIGFKLKIIKDVDKAMEKAERMVIEFKTAMRYVTANPLHLCSIILISLIEVFITYSIPFFLCVALGGAKPSWELLYQTFTLGAYAFYAVSFIPTPGNSGFQESYFAMVFSGVKLTSNVIFWLVLIWRFLTYYVYIVIGIGIILFDFFHKRIQTKRQGRMQQQVKDAETQN